MSRLLELRVYTLKSGTRAAFQRRLEEEIQPMLGRFGIEVVRAGPSLHDELSFCLLRRFPSIAEREAQLERFYGSEEWLDRHDAEVMAMIETYSTCVVEEG
jgi:hypothetical protein